MRAEKLAKVPLDLDAAAEWIFKNCFADKVADVDEWTFVPKIKAVISFIEEHSLEVPFIQHYRKEYYMVDSGFNSRTPILLA